MERKLALVKWRKAESGGSRHITAPRVMNTLEDSAAGNSFALRCLDSLTVAEHALADKYNRLFWFHATDNLDVGPVVKAGLDASLLGFVIIDGENKRARSLDD